MNAGRWISIAIAIVGAIGIAVGSGQRFGAPLMALGAIVIIIAIVIFLFSRLEMM